MFVLVRMFGPAYLGMSCLQTHQETLWLACCYREAHCLDMDVTQSSSLTLSCGIMCLCLPHTQALRRRSLNVTSVPCKHSGGEQTSYCTIWRNESTYKRLFNYSQWSQGQDYSIALNFCDGIFAVPGHVHLQWNGFGFGGPKPDTLSCGWDSGNSQLMWDFQCSLYWSEKCS